MPFIDILVPLLVVAAVVAMLAAAWYFVGKSGRADELDVKSVDRLFSLTPGAISREVTWSLDDTANGSEVVGCVSGELKAIGASVLRQDEKQAAYVYGSRGGGVPPDDESWQAGGKKLPTRILIDIDDAHHPVELHVRLDEDYRLRDFDSHAGPRIRDRYEDAFDRILFMIRQSLSRYQPTPMEVHGRHVGS